MENSCCYISSKIKNKMDLCIEVSSSILCFGAIYTKMCFDYIAASVTQAVTRWQQRTARSFSKRCRANIDSINNTITDVNLLICLTIIKNFYFSPLFPFYIILDFTII